MSSDGVLLVLHGNSASFGLGFRDSLWTAQINTVREISFFQADFLIYHFNLLERFNTS